MYTLIRCFLGRCRSFVRKAALVSLVAIAPAAFAIGTPTLLTPAHNAVGYTQYPNFTWSAVTGAVSYEIQIASDALFTNIVQPGTSDITRYVPPAPLYQANRFWRVRALDAAGTPGAWSSGFIYKLTAPANNVSVTSSMSLIAIRDAINNATTPAKITFAAGTYNFSFSEDYAFTITGKQNLIIDGGNATFILQKPSAGFMNLKNCQSVTVRNFKIDYNPLPHSVGAVVSVTTDTRGTTTTSDDIATVALQVEAGYPAFDAPHMLSNWSWGVILDGSVVAAKRGRMKPNTSLVMNFVSENVRRDATDPTIFHVQLSTASQATQFAAGDRVIIFAREGGRALMAADSQVVDATFDNVVNYASPASHYSSINASEIKILNCQSVKHPSGTRWFAGNADGVHARANLVGPWIQNCTFGGIGDDSVALYNKGIMVKEHVSDTEVKVIDEFNDLQVNDTFTIFNPRAGTAIGATYTVVSRTSLANVNGNGNWKIAFTPALPAGTTLVTDNTDKGHNDQLFNLTRRNRGFVVRDNLFDGVRRYGTVARSPGGVIRHNTYSGISNSAIALLNEPSSWYNGLFSENVLIVDNTIEDSGFDRSKVGNGDIHVALRALSSSTVNTWRAHGGIFIEANRIKNWNQRAISVEQANGATIVNNVVSSTVSGFVLSGSNYGIYYDHTTGTVLSGNDFTGEARSLTAQTFSGNDNN